MSGNCIAIRMRWSVTGAEERMNAMLDIEADQLCRAQRYKAA